MYLKPSEQIKLILKLAEEHRNFLHLRFNDGEVNNMFRLLSERATCSGEHHHFRDMGKVLLRTFEEYLTYCRIDNSCLLGSFAFTEHFFAHDNGRGAKLLLSKIGDTNNIVCAGSDLWYSTKEEEDQVYSDKGLFGLFDFLRDKRKVVLVGNHTIKETQYCLGAEFFEVPRVDCWLQRENIVAELIKKVIPYTVFVWCCGIPGKIWAWEIFKAGRCTSHLDMGHFFDLYADVKNRAWQKRTDGSHYRYYTEQIIPYIKKFVK